MIERFGYEAEYVEFCGGWVVVAVVWGVGVDGDFDSLCFAAAAWSIAGCGDAALGMGPA